MDINSNEREFSQARPRPEYPAVPGSSIEELPPAPCPARLWVDRGDCQGQSDGIGFLTSCARGEQP